MNFLPFTVREKVDIFRDFPREGKTLYINISNCFPSPIGQGGKVVVRQLSHDDILPLSLTKKKSTRTNVKKRRIIKWLMLLKKEVKN